jgi:hypothetical protein
MRTRILGAGCTALLALALTVSSASAQTAETRYGQWKMQSSAPPPSSNIMTYEPYMDGGMKITVASVNGDGRANVRWSARRGETPQSSLSTNVRPESPIGPTAG